MRERRFGWATLASWRCAWLRRAWAALVGGRGREVGLAAALCALAVWSFWQRYALLFASPFPLGVDGYFYPVELRALLAHGGLAYPASPVALYLLAPFAAATDPITGAKLGAAVLGAAIAWPAYGVAARLGACGVRAKLEASGSSPTIRTRRSEGSAECDGRRSPCETRAPSRGAGLLAAVLATTSPGSAYLTVEFVKNGIGLTVALVALWLVLRAVERPVWPRVALAVSGCAAAWATHKLAAVIVVAVAAPAVLAAAWPAARASRVLRGRRWLLIAAAAGLAVIALAIGGAFPRQLLSAGDAVLLRGLWTATPRWTAPALVLPDGELRLGHDALLGLGLGVVGVAVRLVRWRRHRGSAGASGGAAAAWPILVLAIVVGLPFLAVTDREGLGFRLRLAAFVPAALCAAIVARDLLARFRYGGHALAGIAIVLAVLRQPGDSSDRRIDGRIDGEVVTHPALVSAALALRGRVPDGATLIVPERHIAFLVAWYTGAPVALRPERTPPGERYRLLPLHFIGAGSRLDDLLMAARAEPALPLPIGVHPRHPDGLVLVAEPTWTWILGRLPPADRAYFTAWPTI